MKLDMKLLIATLIAGIAAAVADIFLYDLLIGTMPRYLLLAILIAVVAVVVVVTIMVVAQVNNNTDDTFLFLCGKGPIILGVVVCMVLLLALTAGLEYIYEREEIESVSASSYIFILDESGSMETNDADCERYTAVQNMMNNMPDQFPYAVYMFSNNCVRIRDMLPVSDGLVERPTDADSTMMGLTFISDALNVVYTDIQNGTIDAGSRPQVILLTDGIANDMDISTGTEILGDYANDGIIISAVGLGSSIDDDLMELIANSTGGSYIHVENAAQLAQGFSSAVISAQRDLLSERFMITRNGLYGFLRVLFLTLIGALFAFIKAMASAKSGNEAVIMIVGAVAALVGALLMEFGTLLGLPAVIFRTIYLVAIAVTPGYEEVNTATYGTDYIQGYQDVFSMRR